MLSHLYRLSFISQEPFHQNDDRSLDILSFSTKLTETCEQHKSFHFTLPIKNKMGLYRNKPYTAHYKDQHIL